MLDGIITAITDFVRSLIWGIPSVFLWLLDFLWSVTLRIAALNISDIAAINNWYILISTTVVLFVVYKIVKITVKIFLDEEYREKIKLSKVIINVSLCSTLITMIPIGYAYLCNVSTGFVENIAVFIPGSSDDMSMSNILMQAGRIDVETQIDADMKPEINRYDDTFHINAKDDDGNYRYFPTFSSIFLMIIITVIASFVFLMIGIQIGQRMALIGFKYLFAPKAVASIIDSEDPMFGTWMKLITGDLIMNFAQIYGTYFVLFLCNNANVQSMLGNDAVGLFASIMFFIGGLLGVQEIPTMVSYLTGGSGKGIMQSLQDMKATTAVGAGIAGAGLATAGAVASGGLSIAGSGFSIGQGAYQAAGGGLSGIGAVAGALSKAPFNAMGNKVKSGVDNIKKRFNSADRKGSMDSRNNHKNSHPDNNSHSNQSDTSNHTESSGSNRGNTTTFDGNSNQPPTPSQVSAATEMGIINAASMSKSELATAFQEAGGDISYWSDLDKGESFDSIRNTKNMASTEHKEPKNKMSSGFTYMYQNNASRKKEK